MHERSKQERAMEGLAPETYARMAREKNKRQLLCMLRDGRKDLAHHKASSFMGRQAKKAIKAAEDELRHRGMTIPAIGEETPPKQVPPPHASPVKVNLEGGE